ETLRAASMPGFGSDGVTIIIGDRGTALVRSASKGWIRESTGTEENLYALGRVVQGDTRARIVAVGTHGTALIRDTSGLWRAEATNVTEDLYAVGGDVAVGAGGTMLVRAATGHWARVETWTKADLYALGGCGEHHLCAVGQRGTIIDCVRHGELVCVPRAP